MSGLQLLSNLIILLLHICFITSCKFSGSVTQSNSNPLPSIEIPIVDPPLDISITVNKLYPNNGNWNDYVKNSDAGSNVFHQNDISCDGSETEGYWNCIHGGEKIKVSVIGVATCSGASMVDSLNLFLWRCEEFNGAVAFYSVRLKEAKGLSDLINLTSWRENKVILTVAGASFESTSSEWWSNPIIALTSNGAGTAETLDTPGTIYIVNNSALTTGYNINADKIAFVVRSGEVLTNSDSTINNCNSVDGESAGANKKCLLTVGTQKFLWLEGRFNSAAVGGLKADYGILLYGLRFSQAKMISIENTTTQGLRMDNAHNNLIENLVVANTSGNANIEVNYSTKNTFHNIASYNGSQGMYFYFSTDNSVTNYTGIGSGYILEFDTGDNNSANSITLAHSNYQPFDTWQSSYTTANQILTVNHGTNAIDLSGSAGTNSTFSTISQIASFNNTTGLKFTNANSNLVLGHLLLANNATDCSVSASLNMNIDGSCTVLSGNLTVQLGGYDISNTFVGKISSEDLINSSDANATFTTYPANISNFDWLGFETIYRGWGKDGSSFPNADNRARWTTGNGRIWDWRLSASDTQILNKSGNGLTLNGTFQAGGACPVEVRGDNFAQNQQLTPKKYLLNAEEIIYDGIGNENGLCESNEACVYSPNFGAYQGHGTYLANQCSFDNNGDANNNVTGVIMYAYENNGI